MLLRSDPFRGVDLLTTRVFDTNTRSAGARLDAYRDGNTFYIDIDLPGVDPASIDVTVDRNVLTVRAERRRAQRDGIERLVSERPMGTVTRRLVLADTLDTDRLEASYDNGVLTLRIPLAERALPRKVTVTPGRATELATAA
jgi:HSP20 family protein